VGLCQRRKTALRTLVVTFNTTHCSDRNIACLGFKFSVHKAASTVECHILEAYYSNDFSGYTAIKTTIF